MKQNWGNSQHIGLTEVKFFDSQYQEVSFDKRAVAIFQDGQLLETNGTVLVNGKIMTVDPHDMLLLSSQSENIL